MGVFGLAFVVASCLGSPCHADGHLAVGIRPVPGALARIEKLAAPLGEIESRDSQWGAFVVRLRPGVSTESAKARLERARGVLFVRESDPHVSPEDTDLTCAASLTRLLDELKARNADREAITKAKGLPPLSKDQKIKTGYYEAWLFWLHERSYPKNRIDYAAYDRAIRHREQMPAAFGAQEDGFGGATWQYVGPRNLDIPYRTYYGLRPINGRVGALVVDPSNPTTLYMGGANGGLWKSTDSGVNWTPMTDGWQTIAISSVAVHPSDPQTIYVGTGDFHGSRIYSFGIMKTTDGGATWTNQGNSQFGTRAISSIQLDPENPQIVTITTGRSSGGTGFVWRSTNGGATWTNVLNTSANWCSSSIGARDANGDRAYYVSGSGTGGNVWRSMNRGSSWTRLTTPASAGSHSVIMVAASPSFPGTVYMVANADRKVFKSMDYGATWTDITAGFPNGNNNYFWSQSTYNWFLACSSKPGPVDVLYVGMIDAAQSPDGGATWRSIGGPTYVSTALTHNDQQSIQVDPTNPNVVYVGSDGGAYRYTFNPGTNNGTWSYLSANLGITMFYKCDLHPTSSTWLIGGTQDNATPVAVGDLANWENCGGGDGGFCAIDQNTPTTQYATAQNLYVYRTTNAWTSQSVIAPNYGTDPVAFIAPITLDPNDSNFLYGATNYLYRRNNQTATWENRVGGQALSGTGTVRFIAVAPGDPNRIYTSASDGQVWMTSNRGATWTQINTGSPGLPNRVFNYISINPANKNDILLTCGGTGTGHLWRCSNVTAPTRVWQDLSGSGPTGLPNVNTNTIRRDPFDFEGTLYVGNDLGAFVSEDGGASWANATWPLGLPNVQVNDLKVQLSSNTLYAATYGRGFWRIALPPIVYPSSAQVVSGTPFGGGLNELRNSDDRYMTVLGDDFIPMAQVVFTGTSTVLAPSELHFFLETSSPRTDIRQTLEFYNYALSRWDVVDQRFMTVGDSRFIEKVIGNAAPYVQLVTGQVRARVTMMPDNDVSWPVDGWEHWIDRAVWRAVP